MRDGNIYWPLDSEQSEAKMEYVGWCRNIYCSKGTTEEEKEEFKNWLKENDYVIVSCIG